MFKYMILLFLTVAAHPQPRMFLILVWLVIIYKNKKNIKNWLLY